jgi:flagellar basal-body rod protein FlgB
LQSRGSVDDAALAQIRPVLFVQAAEEASNAVGLDTQMAALAENSLQYQALLKGLSRQFSILSSAVSDGKK